MLFAILDVNTKRDGQLRCAKLTTYRVFFCEVQSHSCEYDSTIV